MATSKYFMKLSDDERENFISNITIAFNKLDKNRYPYINENIQKDESRLALIERIINEVYSRSMQPTMEQVFNKIEISLAD